MTNTKEFKLISKFCSRDEFRPVLNCVSFEPEGYAVATDGSSLARIKSDFPAEYAGKLISRDGREMHGAKFPQYKTVVPKPEKCVSFVFPALQIKKKLRSLCLSRRPKSDKCEICLKIEHDGKTTVGLFDGRKLQRVSELAEARRFSTVSFIREHIGEADLLTPLKVSPWKGNENEFAVLMPLRSVREDAIKNALATFEIFAEV